MKQIITQHGWGLNKYFWDDYKVDFLNYNWHWQDNERGYFSTNNYQAKWIKSESKKEIRMTLCHSFGFHLMQKRGPWEEGGGRDPHGRRRPLENV